MNSLGESQSESYECSPAFYEDNIYSTVFYTALADCPRCPKALLPTRKVTVECFNSEPTLAILGMCRAWHLIGGDGAVTFARVCRALAVFSPLTTTSLLLRPRCAHRVQSVSKCPASVHQRIGSLLTMFQRANWRTSEIMYAASCSAFPALTIYPPGVFLRLYQIQFSALPLPPLSLSGISWVRCFSASIDEFFKLCGPPLVAC